MRNRRKEQKKMENFKKRKAVTLVALVITIIILLILAGIILNLTIGQDGILTKAQKAGENYTLAEKEESNQLEKLLSYESLPENTKTTIAGTPVKMPENWYSTRPAEISTKDGSVVTEEVKIASVVAIATGNGESVPVPKGFYYVGGTISSGVVISDNPADQNKYAGKEDVPPGVQYNEDGTVKTYTDEEYKTLPEDEKKNILLGNQFVWIPCKANEYKKVDWGVYLNTNWERQTNTAELPQIEKYEGFYIGRYEAGTSNITLSTGINFAEPTIGVVIDDNYSIRDGLNHTVNGKVTLKAGEIPYYHADYETALNLSNNMYCTDYVRSGLATGTMWDVMLKFIANGDDSVVTASKWGNYSDTNITYKNGQGRYAAVTQAYGAMTASAFVKCDGTYHNGVNTTGISEDVKKKNLYDVAGNLFEWTQETSYVNTTETYMIRGGANHASYTVWPACFRGYQAATATYTEYGFRPVLYIK